MDKNTIYNLMLQYTVESRSLWRIRNDYLSDAEGDEETTTFWQNLAKEKESHIETIKSLIKERI